MTDDEVIKAVTARLAGEFYVGQRVVAGDLHSKVARGYVGTVVALNGEELYPVSADPRLVVKPDDSTELAYPIARICRPL